MLFFILTTKITVKKQKGEGANYFLTVIFNELIKRI